MILVDAAEVSMSRPGRPLLDRVSLTVSTGDRIGVVGLNGTGKSTLLDVLTGAREPESGVVRRGRDVRIAEQRVEPIEALLGATLVEVRPVTGFLHQIRATLAHIGHPILGDRTYAPPDVAAASERHLLHAARVGFEEIEAHAPDPPDLAAAVERLRAPGPVA